MYVTKAERMLIYEAQDYIFCAFDGEGVIRCIAIWFTSAVFTASAHPGWAGPRPQALL